MQATDLGEGDTETPPAVEASNTPAQPAPEPDTEGTEGTDKQPSSSEGNGKKPKVPGKK